MPRFQFSLRTLLIVVTLLAIPCGWLGWQAKIVAQRKEFCEELFKRGGWCVDVAHNPSFPRKPLPQLPWIRRLLGDSLIVYIHVPGGCSDAELAKIDELFPEIAASRETD